MNSLALLLATVMASMAAVPILPNELEYCEFSSKNHIVQQRILTDYSGNKFKLYELQNGYAIYSLENGQEIFLEGSHETQSPYYNYLDKDLFYLGPGNYFYENGGNNYDIFSQSPVKIDLHNASFQTTENVENIQPYSSSEPNPNETKTDINGFTVINKADYFKNLKYFPQNHFGECGLIALSILLGYYDTFYNDNFIPDITYKERHYKDAETRSGTGDKVLDYITENTLVKKTTTINKNTSNYDYTNWTSMPGTNYAMRDYLFDNYMHTFWGMGWEDAGYPMMDGELKSTFNDYIDENAPSLKNTYEVRSGHIFYTNARPKEYINEGNPACLVLQSYTSTAGSGKAHVVVAYGYKDGEFLTHFGWWPGYIDRASVIVSSSVIYGYFSIKYNGAHVHSQNVTMTSRGTNYGICGCGHVSIIG